MTSDQLFYMSLLYAGGEWSHKGTIHSQACNALGVETAKAARTELKACEWIEFTQEHVRATEEGLQAVERRVLELI